MANWKWRRKAEGSIVWCAKLALKIVGKAVSNMDLVGIFIWQYEVIVEAKTMSHGEEL